MCVEDAPLILTIILIQTLRPSSHEPCTSQTLLDVCLEARGIGLCRGQPSVPYPHHSSTHEMQSRTINMMQTLFDGEFGLFKIPTTIVKEAHLDAEVLSGFDHVRPIGVSPGYSSSGKLVAIAIADDQHCVIVEFNVAGPRRGRSNNTPPSRNEEGLQLLQRILCRTAGDLIAFDMGPLTMSLYCDAHRLRVHNAVDVQSGVSAVDRKPLSAIKAIIGTEVPIKEINVDRKSVV